MKKYKVNGQAKPKKYKTAGRIEKTGEFLAERYSRGMAA